LDGSEPKELTKPVTYFDPVWSANGEEIAFAAESRGESALHVVEADGKGLRRLNVDYPPGDLVWGPVRWSPDGTTLLAQGGRQGIWQTAVISLGSGRVRTIPDGIASAWSPDGTTIALVVNHPKRLGPSAAGLSSSLATIHRDGTGLRKLAEAEGVFDYPVWTPDGQSILFAERGVDTTRILQIPANGGPVRTLLRDPGLQTFYHDSLTVSPDGKRVALVSNEGIEVVSLVSSQRTLIVGGPGLVTELAWSPDGKELGYVASPENGDEPARLYVINADGSDRRMISKPAESVASFDWRPKGASA
jgi:Tol biopolymer transport system component